MHVPSIQVSPSRTYMALCNKADWQGYYFIKFRLPEKLDNNTARAINYLFEQDAFVCIDKVITWEEYSAVIDRCDEVPV